MDADPNPELGGGSGLEAVTDLNELSEDCLVKVVSFTTPRDSARLSSVSKVFKSAADSDPVWETFLPSDYRSLVPSSSLELRRKQIYLSLCDQPILIDDGKKSFWLEKKSGKKCYMLAPRDLYICWGDSPLYWTWISLPESRFPEVAELVTVCWLNIIGCIDTRILSKETLYTAHFVFKLRSSAYGFVNQYVEVSIELTEGEGSRKTVYLDYQTRGSIPSGLKIRRDGWMEVELGEFYNNGDMEEELTLILQEIKQGHWKTGLIVQGFEMRPKICV